MGSDVAERVDEGRPEIPRAIAGLIIGAIAMASIAALLWPSLPFNNEQIRPGSTNVSVVQKVDDAPDAAGRIGSTAPDFEWVRPDAKRAKLSDLRGRVVVINFWATWCVPCKREMPALERAARAEPGVSFLAVDLMENGERVRGFFDQLALERLEPILDTDGAVARRYSVFGLPSTFFVGADGIIRHFEVNEMTDEHIARGIAKAR